MVMAKISIEKAKDIANRKGLKPGRVRATRSGVQLTKGNNPNVEIVTWDEFEKNLKDRRLAIYEWNGWLKIMKE